MRLKLSKEFIDLYREEELTYQILAQKLNPQDPQIRKYAKKYLGDWLSDEKIQVSIEAKLHAIGCRYAARVIGDGVETSISNEDGSYFSEEFLKHANDFFPNKEKSLPLLYRDAVNSANPLNSVQDVELLISGSRLYYKLNEIRQVKSGRPKVLVIRR